MSVKLYTIDAETLLATPLQPVPFIVDGLIPRGLHILAGSPKIGKRWLVLWLCLKVAAGEPVWDATKLLAKMGDTSTAVNTATKLLNRYHSSVLAENGIEYQFSRVGVSRLIKLKSDGYDSCDSSISPGKQPSPTVTCGDGKRGAGVSPATHLACKV